MSKPPSSSNNLSVAATIVVVVAVSFYLIWLGRAYEWTGFGPFVAPSTPPDQEYERAKTLWDWLNLLIIPLVLLGLGYFLSNAERRRDREIAEQKAEYERKNAERNAQDTALATYLDQMTKLLIGEGLKSESKNETRDVARVWTLSTVPRVGADHKGMVLEFLHESRLIRGSAPVISLEKMNFKGADLIGASLVEANLSGTDLSGANLTNAGLHEANLGWADLRGANLSGARLYKADLRGADLREANLSKVDFNEADLSGANFSGANFSGADLSGAILSGTNLRGAISSIKTTWPKDFDWLARGVKETS